MGSARQSTTTLTMERYSYFALAETSKVLAMLPALPTGEAMEA